MDIPAVKGKRNDLAYFAHYENFVHDEVPEGQIIISVLTQGWSWRIPLPGRMSVGVVINKEHLKDLGDTPEERLENIIKREPLLRDKAAHARRVTDVMTYTNYQLLSERGHGPGWILLGDAFGFVDPMLSPGLFMALEGARLLDEHVFGKGTSILEQPAALKHALDIYSKNVVEWHNAWMTLVEYFYNGEIFRAYQGGQQLCRTYGKWHWIRLLERHANFQIAAMASGGKTRSRYSQGFLRFLCQHMVKDVPPAVTFAVH
jgi:flavin-dependent dehydrogenase